MSKSSNIVTFPKHKLHRCNCRETSCMYCAGGLSLCTTCGGAEGSLPEHCPQRRMTDEEEAAVYSGTLDYRLSEGGWTTWTKAHALMNKSRLT